MAFRMLCARCEHFELCHAWGNCNRCKCATFERPATAIGCTSCETTGKLQYGACSRCGGRGWIVPDSLSATVAR